MADDPKLQKLRARIGEIKTEIDRLQSGVIPVPMATALARADGLVERLRTAGDERLNVLARNFSEPDGRQFQLIDFADKGRDALPELLAALDPEKLRATLHAKVRGEYQQIDETLTPAEIQTRVGKLRTELDKVEVDDFRLADQLGIAQRPDAPAHLLLLGTH